MKTGSHEPVFIFKFSIKVSLLTRSKTTFSIFALFTFGITIKFSCKNIGSNLNHHLVFASNEQGHRNLIHNFHF